MAFCPKCKHDTLQLKVGGGFTSYYAGYYFTPGVESHRQCLVCGEKWVEESKAKTVAYKEPK